MQSSGLTRSGLIKAGGAAALAAGAGGFVGRALAGGGDASKLAGSAVGRAHGGPAYLSRATYAPLVGTDFRVHVPGEKTLRLKLIEARALKGPGDAFSLLFRGRRQADVKSGTYRIEHRTIGSFDLFVNPVGRGVKGLDLEAVINRIAT
jgi:uncharacterized protein DUF6916